MKATIETLDSVIAAGEAVGYWTGQAPELAHGGRTPWRDVIDSDGRRFTLGLRDGKVTAAVARLASGAIRIMPSDVLPRDAGAPFALASGERDPATIAKDLHRRVTGHADGIACADKVRATLAERIEQRAALLAHVAKLTTQGYRVRHGGISESECYEAPLSGTGNLPELRVTASGAVYVDRLTVHVDDVPQLAKIAR